MGISQQTTVTARCDMCGSEIHYKFAVCDGMKVKNKAVKFFKMDGWTFEPAILCAVCSEEEIG